MPVMETGVYIVGTPIGNLEDITARALRTLREANVIMAEDTRHTGILLARYEIRTPMVSCHKFNEAYRFERIRDEVAQGHAVAMVTDAGMPGISDPGARTVRMCRAAGIPVWVIPGPCAVSAAMSLSGMGDAGYHFEGFLPHKSGGRQRRLEELSHETLPVVFYESPYRLIKLMDQIEQFVGPRRIFVGRELTKKFEEGISGTPAEIRASFEKRSVKGEIVVIMAPAEKGQGAHAVTAH
ncbi:MAG: 16S rRNA (cytidine(1402)-2'-O)-methyltransferase [Kiritimatiellia bacterium]